MPEVKYALRLTTSDPDLDPQKLAEHLLRFGAENGSPVETIKEASAKRMGQHEWSDATNKSFKDVVKPAPAPKASSSGKSGAKAAKKVSESSEVLGEEQGAETIGDIPIEDETADVVAELADASTDNDEDVERVDVDGLLASI